MINNYLNLSFSKKLEIINGSFYDFLSAICQLHLIVFFAQTHKNAVTSAQHLNLSSFLIPPEYN